MDTFLDKLSIGTDTGKGFTKKFLIQLASRIGWLYTVGKHFPRGQYVDSFIAREVLRDAVTVGDSLPSRNVRDLENMWRVLYCLAWTGYKVDAPRSEVERDIRRAVSLLPEVSQRKDDNPRGVGANLLIRSEGITKAILLAKYGFDVGATIGELLEQHDDILTAAKELGGGCFDGVDKDRRTIDRVLEKHVERSIGHGSRSSNYGSPGRSGGYGFSRTMPF